MDNIIYADYINDDSGRMFAFSNDGYEFIFESPEFDDTHSDVIVVDPETHKIYTVKFNE